MLVFALHLYFSAFMYLCACLLHLENQRAVYRCPLNLGLGQPTLLVFCRGAVRIRANGAPFSHSLRSTSSFQRYAAPDSLLRLD